MEGTYYTVSFFTVKAQFLGPMRGILVRRSPDLICHPIYKYRIFFVLFFLPWRNTLIHVHPLKLLVEVFDRSE